MSKILLVDAPGAFRDSLLAAVQARGAEAITRDDAMEALATSDQVEPDVILIGEDPGSLGADSLGRILSSRAGGTQVFQLGELGEAGPLPSDAAVLSRALGATGLAAVVLGSEAPPELAEDDELEVPARGLPALLLELCDRHETGVLTLVGEQVERELSLVRGIPVSGSSTRLDERLGALALSSGHIDELTLKRALHLSRDRDVRLGQALLELGAMAGDDLHRMLGVQLRVQMTRACMEGPCRARFSPRPSLVDELPLLPTEPMCAILTAVRREPQQVREGAFGALAGSPVEVGISSPSIDRWLRSVGIDVATSIDGASSFGAMLDSLSIATGEEEEVDPQALALALVWSGRIRPQGELPEAAALFSPRERALPGAGQAITPPGDELGRALERRLLPAPREADVHTRALYGAEAEADESAAELHALYLTAKATRDARAALAVAQNASHTEIRRAYLARLDQLDAHATPTPALECMALELRHHFDRARDRILPPQAPNESIVPVAPADVLSVPPDSLAPEPDAVTSTPPPVPKEAVSASPPPVPGPEEAETSPEPPADEVEALRPVGITQADAAPIEAPDAAQPEAIVEPDAVATKKPFLTKAEIEQTDAVLEQGNWPALIEALDGRDGEPVDLPAPLRLLYAIALRENDSTGAERTAGPSPERLGRSAVGELLQVPRNTAIVRVISRRLLRKRPLLQKPPSRGVSFIVTAIALAVGVGGGLIFSGEIFELLWK